MASTLYSTNFFRRTTSGGSVSPWVGFPEGYVAVIKSFIVISNDVTSILSGGTVLVQAGNALEEPTVIIAEAYFPPATAQPLLFESALGFVYLGPDADDSAVFFRVVNELASDCDVALDGYLLRFVEH